MKRELIAAILGVTASVNFASSAHAQGRVFFNNYGNTTYAPVYYGPDSGGPVGTGLNNTFTAGLWYFLGTATLSAGFGFDTLPAGWEQASVTQQFNSGATAGPAGAGFFSGPIATISDYVSGPITFAVTAYNGTAYNSPATTLSGHSASFTLSSIATGLTPSGEFGPGLQSFSLILIPEPSMFALSGLGAAGWVLIRRRKQAR